MKLSAIIALALSLSTIARPLEKPGPSQSGLFRRIPTEPSEERSIADFSRLFKRGNLFSRPSDEGDSTREEEPPPTPWEEHERQAAYKQHEAHKQQAERMREQGVAQEEQRNTDLLVREEGDALTALDRAEMESSKRFRASLETHNIWQMAVRTAMHQPASDRKSYMQAMSNAEKTDEDRKSALDSFSKAKQTNALARERFKQATEAIGRHFAKKYLKPGEAGPPSSDDARKDPPKPEHSAQARPPHHQTTEDLLTGYLPEMLPVGPKRSLRSS